MYIAKKMKYSKALLFTVLVYVLCWPIVFTYFGQGGSVDSPWFMLVAMGCMSIPAAVAIVVQKLFYRAPLADIGLALTFNRWFVFAALLPIVLVGATVLVSALVPEVRLSSGIEFIREQLVGIVPAEQAEKAIERIERLGVLFPLLLVGSALVAGSTINAIPALGEELGWRGLLQTDLAPLGFWRSSAVVGLVWGLWHLPIIMNGYNYPEHPVLGVFMMTLMTMLLSPILAFVRLKAGSVLAAAILHGVFNAFASLPLLFLIGGSRLTTGVTGAAGAIVLVLANAAIFLYLRRHKTLISQRPGYG